MIKTSTNTYTILNFETKASAELTSTSFETAIESFTGSQPTQRSFHNVSGIRMYSINGQTIGISLA